MWTSRRGLLRLCIGALCLLAGLLHPASGQSLFYYPIKMSAATNSLILGKDGNFYGTTANTTTTPGNIFRLTPAGSETTLYTFAGGSPGTGPYGDMLQGADGSFYGQTRGDGANVQGTIFKLAQNGTLTTLHAFTTPQSDGTNADGLSVIAPLIQGSDGTLYGVTASGGPGGAGVVFKLGLDGTYTVLHAFSNPGSSNTNGDGVHPDFGLTAGLDGNFYGITHDGGPGNTGTIFKITSGGSFTLLYAFSALNSALYNADGANPEALFLNADGSFTGLTEFGGTTQGGTIFTITPGGAFSVQATAQAQLSNQPLGFFRDDRGRFYGIFYSGPCGEGCYNVYYLQQMTSTGFVRTVAIMNESAMLFFQSKNGLIYGFAENGGENPDNGIFRLSVVTPDLNADGLPDLLWQNQVTGEVVYTYMNGLTPLSWGDLLTNGFGVFNTTLPIVGLASVDKDYASPSLLFQDPATGDVSEALLQGTYVLPRNGNSILFTGINPNYKLVGTPDLNKDGVPDILWQNQVTGEVVYTLMNPGDPLAWGDLFKHIDTAWKIVGTPDLNGDGWPDLLFQNSATGDVVYALMQGLTVVQWGTLFKGIDPNFQIAGTLDLNGDGYPDILWENQTSGEVVYTLIKGTMPVAWGDLFKRINPQFKLVGLH